MAILSKKEKEELLRFSKSLDFRKEMRKLKCHKKKLSVDEYIDFLNFCAKFFNHQRSLRKIKGNNFIL